MLKTSETPRDLRKKLTRSTVSRDLLQEKLRDAKYKIKKLKNCLSAMTDSREKWHFKYKENKLLTKNLENELSNVTQNRDELITKLENTNPLVLKKNTN
jgi:chromosome segregation ATPase